MTQGRTGKAAVVGSVLGRLGLVRETSSVMVGDRLHDVQGAAAHGLHTIGVSWGYAEPDELITGGAIAVVDNPEQLGNLLLSQSPVGDSAVVGGAPAVGGPSAVGST